MCRLRLLRLRMRDRMESFACWLTIHRHTPLAPSHEELTRHDTSQPARTFAYQGEAQCDANLEIFKQCVQAVHNVTPEGFAAVKITALGVPDLLERLSVVLVEAKKLFSEIDTDKNGLLTFSEFMDWYAAMYGKRDEVVGRVIFDRARQGSSDTIDYHEWSSLWTLKDVWKAAGHITHGKLSSLALDAEEMRLVANMHKRINDLGEYAAQQDVRLMIDAEQTYFKHAIDHATLELQLKHNKKAPTIFGTYQCYLKDSSSHVLADLARAQKYNYWFAAKFVRGAYMLMERERAAQAGVPSPVYDTIEDTHANYNNIIKHVLAQPKRNVVVASHNQKSIELVVADMHARGIDPATGGVYFAQLLGMADHLTFSLGANGYKAYKYVPYGPLHEVIPYLIRRAQVSQATPRLACSDSLFRRRTAP